MRATSKNIILFLLFSILISNLSAQDKPQLVSQRFLLNGTPTEQAGIGNVTIELVFDQAMNTAVNPVVHYSLDSTFSLQLPTFPFWVDGDNHKIWHGIFSISENVPSTEDGTYNFRITGAQSADEMTMDPAFGQQQLTICRPIFELGGDELDFKTVQNGATKDMTLELTNSGCSAFFIDSIHVSQPFFVTDGNVKRTIEPNATLNLTVRFRPTERGVYEQEMVIYSQQLDLKQKVVTLSGTSNGPLMTYTPSKLNFGSLNVGDDKTLSFVVKNLAAEDGEYQDTLTIAPTFQPDSEIYSTPTETLSLLPGDTTVIDVTFSPTDEVNYNNHRLYLNSNDQTKTNAFVQLNGNAADQNPPNEIRNLSVNWGMGYPGIISGEGMQICWENPEGETSVSQIRWKFTRTATPPTSNDDLGSGGFVELEADTTCATLSIGSLSSGFWYCYLWVVDGAGNSGYQSAVPSSFRYDNSAPNTPFLIGSNVINNKWFTANDTISVDLRLSSDNQVSDVSRVYVKFGDIPASATQYNEYFDVRNTSNNQTNVSVPFQATGCGNGQVHFWVSDSAGNFSDYTNPVTIDYRYDACPPVITAASLKTEYVTEVGSTFRDTVRVTDERGVKNVWVEYRLAGSNEAEPGQNMFTTLDDDLYVVEIWSGAITQRGLEFRIVAEDSSGLIATGPAHGDAHCHEGDEWYVLQTRITGDGPVQVDEYGHQVELIAGKNSSDYQLISVPFIVDEPDIESVMFDDLGEYRISKWRLYDYNTQNSTGQRWLEGRSAREFEPGRAFFVITRSEGVAYDIGPANTFPTLCPDSIQVYEGWNLVATPFNFTIDEEDLSLVNSESPVILHPYRNGWELANVMKPWRGYALYVTRTEPGPMYLVINPKETERQLAKATVATPASTLGPGEWAIQISAFGEHAQDKFNWLGVKAAAKPGFDFTERAEPPTIGEFVSVAFNHPDWQQPSDKFSTDFRPPSDENQTWEFEVNHNVPRQSIQLTFDVQGEIPSHRAIYLIDEQSGRMQNLADKNEFVFISNEQSTRILKLVVGDAQFIQETAEALDRIPTEITLQQNYPNPFNPETSIRFALPEANMATLQIFNSRGQLVQTLVHNQQLRNGYHTYTWRGLDKNGVSVPSGIYLSKLQVGDQQFTRKMLLLR